jgi:hypothetical protein
MERADRNIGSRWRLPRLGGVLLACHAVLGCTPGEPGSCLREKENICIEYTRAQGAAGKRMCAVTWLAGEKSCPTTSLLGACVKKDGVESFYSGPPNNYGAASAKSKCEWGSGVFRPAPSASAP